MADVAAFQKKLADICTLAKINGKKISKEGVALFFEEEDLREEQLQKVLEYLKLQGIHVIGEQEEEADVSLEDSLTGEPVPLTPEEAAYLQAYEATLRAPGEGTILEQHMHRVVALAKEYHYGDSFIGDLIQEGSISLMTALEEKGEAITGEEAEAAIRKGLYQAAASQVRQDYADHFLVEKVRHLEASIRELTEGVGEKSSIEELSAFLDMEEEEIRAVLRLTGDMEG